MTVALLRGGVITFHDEDQQLAKIVERDLQPSFVEFVAALVRECVFGEQPCASRMQFHHCIDAINKVSLKGVITES